MIDQHEPETAPAPPASPTSHSRSWAILFSVFFILVLAATEWAIYQIEMQLQKQETALIHIEETQHALSLQPVQQQLDELKKTVRAEQATLSQHEQQIHQEMNKRAYPETESRIAEADHLIYLIAMQQTLHAPQTQIDVLLGRLKALFQNETDAISSDITQFITDAITKRTEFDVPVLFTELTTLEKSLNALELRILLPPYVPKPPVKELETKNLPWWKVGLEKSWEVLQRIVIVRKTPHPEKPLVLPEEKALLMQNIHANINFAKWGLLNRQPAVYESSLNELIQWINSYFDLTKELTQKTLKQLELLKSKNILPTVVDTAALKNKLNDYQQHTRAQPSVENK